jgi:hypothetical protein
MSSLTVECSTGLHDTMTMHLVVVCVGLSYSRSLFHTHCMSLDVILHTPCMSLDVMLRTPCTCMSLEVILRTPCMSLDVMMRTPRMSLDVILHTPCMFLDVMLRTPCMSLDVILRTPCMSLDVILRTPCTLFARIWTRYSTFPLHGRIINLKSTLFVKSMSRPESYCSTVVHILCILIHSTTQHAY